MTVDSIKLFLSLLNVRKDSIRVTEDFVNGACPLAFFTHKRHEDRNPSFGVKIDQNRSYYYCFTCSPWPAGLDVLVHNYWLMYGKYPYEVAKLLLCENQEVPVVEYEEKWKEPDEILPLPQYVINQFPLLQYSHDSKAIQCKRYLERRGIPEWVYNYCRVRYDTKYGFLVFPLTDAAGKIYMLRARSISHKRMWTIAPEYLGLNYKFPRLSDVGAFLGSHLVDRSKAVMVVEGSIDMMRLISLGYSNTIASNTSAITKMQMDCISSNTVILGMDNDSSGKLAHVRIIKHLMNKCAIYTANWGAAGRKDPGELKNREELKKVMKFLRVIT